jgi:pimeloyl-ACP methyl ester carboxylesterase
MRGLMITGTPPVAREEVGQGFKSGPDMALAGQEVFSARDVESYARSTCGEPFEPSLLDIVARTDGRARRIMFEKFAAGTGGNQRDIAAGATLPIAVVNGRDEPFVELDFVSKVRFGNLWEGKTHVIDNAGHAPFRETPAVFDAYLARFITDCTA